MVYNIAPKCLQKDFCNYNVRIFNGGWFYEKAMHIVSLSLSLALLVSLMLPSAAAIQQESGPSYMAKVYLAKSIKISAVIMAVLLVPYYGQHIYSNVVSFEAIRNMCFSLLSILFVCLYNGQHGSKKKWIYYWAYPLHILFFAILRC